MPIKLGIRLVLLDSLPVLLIFVMAVPAKGIRRGVLRRILHVRLELGPTFGTLQHAPGALKDFPEGFDLSLAKDSVP